MFLLLSHISFSFFSRKYNSNLNTNNNSNKKITKNQKFILFLLVFFHILQVSLTQNQIFCQINIPCDKCNICLLTSGNTNSCGYSNNFCQNEQMGSFQTYKNYFNSLPGLKEACGKTEFIIEKNTKSLSLLTKNSKSYLKENNELHCNYEVVNEYYWKNSDPITVKTSLKYLSNGKNSKSEKGSITVQVFIILSSLKENALISFNDKDLRRGGGNDLTEIQKYYTNQIFIDIKKSPDFTGDIDEYVEIHIENGWYKKFLTTTIITCVIAFLVLFLLIFFYCRFRKRQKERLQLIHQRRRAAIRMARAMRARPNNNQELSEEEIIKKNKKKIDKMMNSIMGVQVYSKNIDETNCLKCTICLEDFKEGNTQVRKTPCKHIFHSECLEELLNQSYLNPMCPNCKYPIASYEFPNEVEINNKPKIIYVNSKENIGIASPESNEEITNKESGGTA